MFTGKYFIEKLNMKKHEEGGYYAEYLKAEDILEDGMRWSSTYFLLKDREVSLFHTIKSDEIWYFNSGTALTVYIIDKNGEMRKEKLGLDIDRGEQPQVLIPKGSIFGAEMDGTGYTLFTCMCAPGYNHNDFKLCDRAELLEKYPRYEMIVKRLTK